MDPASVVGLVGAIVGIADVIARSVNTLKQFQDDYRGADFRVGALVAQLLTIKAALGNVADMVNDSSASITEPSPFSRQFVEDLRVSLYGCEAMVTALNSKLASLTRNEYNGLSASSRFQLVMQGSTIDEYLVFLNNQTSALQLLLTTLHCRSAVARSEMLCQTSARRVFAQVTDDTSSLLWLYDEESLLSLRSNGTQQDLSTISTEFSFDSDLITSKVYRTAMRSHMIYAISTSKDSIHNSRRPATPSSGLRMSRRFSIRSDRVSIAASVRSSKDTIPDSASNSSTSHIRTLFHRSEPLIRVRGVQGKTPLDDAQMSDSGTMYTDDASLRRFWQRRKQPKVPTTKVLQGLAPAFAPKEATNVLVLGLRRSGKSTLTKSLLYSYGCLNMEARQSYVEDIRQETIESWRKVLKEPGMMHYLSGLDVEYHCDVLTGLRQVDLMQAASALCQDPDFRENAANYLKQQPTCGLSESAQYFFDSIERTTMPTYVPSASDILRSYQKTPGYTATSIEAKGKTYNIFDTPGLRGNRPWPWRMLPRADVVVFTFEVTWGSEDDIDASKAMEAQIEGLRRYADLASNWIVLFTKIDKLNVSHILQSTLYSEYCGSETLDGVLDFLARKLSSASGLGISEKERSRGLVARRMTFWKASIAESSTEMAEVVLAALEQLEDPIEEEEEEN